ncbi:hypothetical protein IMAU40003_00142 [Lactiplantibacillus plantarum]|nr:hypothetical protein [Lactiplantibacillus plantarum]
MSKNEDLRRQNTLSSQNEVDNILDSVKKMPEHQQQQMMAKLEMHSGPIPDPETLKKYDELYHGAAKKIIDNGVDESVHRRDLENSMFKAAKNDRQRRDWMAFFLSILGILVGGFLIYMDHYIVGTIFSGVSLIGLVGMYLGTDNSNDDEEKHE